MNKMPGTGLQNQQQMTRPKCRWWSWWWWWW